MALRVWIFSADWN